MLTLKTLLENKNAFINIFSRYYPIPIEFLEQYKNIWNWEAITENKEITWNIELINKYKSRLNPRLRLCANTSLPWSVEFIQKGIDKKIWTWEELKVQEKIIQDPAMLSFCLPEWSKTTGPYSTDFGGGYYGFRFLCWGNNAKEWVYEIIEKCPNFRWDWFSEITKFPWTIVFIEKHKEKLNWKILSANTGLPWSKELVKQFEPYWYWNVLAYEKIPFDNELFYFLKEKLNWRILSEHINFEVKNYNLKAKYWNLEVIKSFADKIWWAQPAIDYDCWEGIMDVDSIINSNDFIWTPQLFNTINKHVESHFKLLEKKYEKEGVKLEDEYWTFFCATNNWSPEFFEFLIEKEKTEQLKFINWKNIVQYARLLWTDEFIKKYTSKIKHFNINYPPSEYPYVEKYLCSNQYFPWNKYINQFKDLLGKDGWLELHKTPTFKPDIEIMEKYKDVWSSWDWEQISKTIQLDMEIVEKFESKFNFSNLEINSTLTTEMVEKYIHKPWRFSDMFRKKFIDWKKIDINKINSWSWRFGYLNLYEITNYLDNRLFEQFLQAVDNKN